MCTCVGLLPTAHSQLKTHDLALDVCPRPHLATSFYSVAIKTRIGDVRKTRGWMAEIVEKNPERPALRFEGGPPRITM